MQTKSKVILALVAIVLLATTVSKLLQQNPVPDKVQIQGELKEAAEDASNKNAGGVMSIISDSYTDSDGNTPDRFGMLLRRGMQNVQDIDVVVAPAAITINGQSAKSSSYISIKIDGQPVIGQVVELDWRKEPSRRLFIIPDEKWRVVHSNYDGGMDN